MKRKKASYSSVGANIESMKAIQSQRKSKEERLFFHHGLVIELFEKNDNEKNDLNSQQ